MPRQGAWPRLRDASGTPPVVNQSGTSRELPPLTEPTKPGEDTQTGA